MLICFTFTPLTSQTVVKTETTLTSDTGFHAVEIQRFKVKKDNFSLTYDLKLSKSGQPVSDIFGITVAKLIETKKFSLDVTGLKVGDPPKGSEYFLDVFTESIFGDFVVWLEAGLGFGPKQTPRGYFIHRVAHKFFTFEAGVVSANAPRTYQEFTKDKYAWLAFHPKDFFVAIGRELKRNWFFFGTKGLKDFGNFTFANHNPQTDEFWFRTQFGIKNANQGYFSQENYLVGTSYLVVPPFFYLHFSPISTKGEYSVKLDAKQYGATEKIELIVGKQFGSIGHFALGTLGEGLVNIPSDLSFGAVMEYFNSISVNKFTGSIELRYETRNKRGSGFVTMGYSF
jgi:hypothetical protein